MRKPIATEAQSAQHRQRGIISEHLVVKPLPLCPQSVALTIVAQHATR